MKISGAFPSKYLKAADLNEQIVDMQIERVEMTDVGTKDEPDEKPVVFFVGHEKGLVLNKTNAGTVAKIHGDDTDGWDGKWISLFEDETDYQGKRVACIRVRIKPPAKPGASKNEQPKDDIPAGKPDPVFATFADAAKYADGSLSKDELAAKLKAGGFAKWNPATCSPFVVAAVEASIPF